MCKYCNVDSFGECFGFINELRHDITINGIEIATIQADITNDDDNEWHLETYMVTWDCEEVSFKKVRIKYCPFCGRKLN